MILIVTSSGLLQQSAQINRLILPSAIAQTNRPREVWQRVYQQLPDLPLENQYVNQETGKVAQENTLVSRLVQYHLYVKGRPSNYRLDWKLTLADYLGANELMNEEVYPGNNTLQKNPIEGDRAAIARLSREQRNALIQTLVSIFNPDYPATSPNSDSSSQLSTIPNPATR